MTCEEFKTLISKDKYTKGFTRGERGALVAHVYKCEACYQDLVAYAEGVRKEKGEAYIAAQAASSHALGQQDRQDPEYREAVGL